MLKNLKRAYQLKNVSKHLRSKSRTGHIAQHASMPLRQGQQGFGRIYTSDAFQRERCPRVRHMRRHAREGENPHLPQNLQNVQMGPSKEKQAQKIDQGPLKIPSAQIQSLLCGKQAYEYQKPKDSISAPKRLKAPQGQKPKGSHRPTRVDAPGQGQKGFERIYTPYAFQRESSPRVRHMRGHAREGENLHLPQNLENVHMGPWEEKQTQKIDQGPLKDPSAKI